MSSESRGKLCVECIEQLGDVCIRFGDSYMVCQVSFLFLIRSASKSSLFY
jgi:hypothetical protein